jgi:hypothetical protein
MIVELSEFTYSRIIAVIRLDVKGLGLLRMRTWINDSRTKKMVFTLVLYKNTEVIEPLGLLVEH